jgi:hypothetical protein
MLTGFVVGTERNSGDIFVGQPIYRVHSVNLQGTECQSVPTPIYRVHSANPCLPQSTGYRVPIRAYPNLQGTQCQSLPIPIYRVHSANPCLPQSTGYTVSIRAYPCFQARVTQLNRLLEEVEKYHGRNVDMFPFPSNLFSKIK